MICKVCIPNTHKEYYDYEMGEFIPCIGARVWVPFRSQKKLGVVIGFKDSEACHQLKVVAEVLDDSPLLPEPILNLCLWIAQYYQSPLSEVLALALPKKYRQGLPVTLPMTEYFQLTGPLDDTLAKLAPRASKKRQLVQWLAQQDAPVSKASLKTQGFTASHWLSLLTEGLIQQHQQPQLPKTSQATQPALQLNAEQEQAVQQVSAHLSHFTCTVVYGVTGSGKTEVYLQVIAQVLAQQKQVLVLVPEIGLTPQLVARFTQRFSQPLAVIHSHLNESERQIAWQRAKEDQVSIVIGTRSAVFTPMPHLGLIVIDEEHDASFKQMEGVRYSARDSALMRAREAHIPVILGSATPCLETLYNVQQNKYQVVSLPDKALSKTALRYQLIDLRAQSLQQGLTQTALQTIKTHLEQDHQVLVFINRRGFSPVLLCHQCGWMQDCKACDSHVTVHKSLGQMICHHCGMTHAIPHYCPQCRSQELIPVGSGTQRIHEVLQQTFPQTKVVRIDKDETRKKHAFSTQLERIHTGEAQLIVGTQMLAKGHHFPRLSLVVILDADHGFYSPDFRALEHLGQLLTQVAGRAGRAGPAGEVLIQTHLPQHPLLNILIQQGYDAFAQHLLAERQHASLPPYQFLALLRAKGKSAAAVLACLTAAKAFLADTPVTVLGPAPAPLPRKAHYYRLQLLIKSPSRPLLQKVLTSLREWLTHDKASRNTRWNIDVDPIDLS